LKIPISTQSIPTDPSRFDFKTPKFPSPQQKLSNVLQELTENAKKTLLDTSSEESSNSHFSLKIQDESNFPLNSSNNRENDINENSH
jgi:hypothetical protein